LALQNLEYHPEINEGSPNTGLIVVLKFFADSE